MRLFVSLDPGEEVRAALSDYMDLLRRSGVRGRYVLPENLHITLAFIGEYRSPRRVMDALDSIEFCGFRGRISGTGAFRSVFWAGISSGGAAEELAELVRGALSAGGIPSAPGRFVPHITLIRRPQFPDGWTAPAPAPAGAVFRGIDLMSSELSHTGAAYRKIGTAELSREDQEG